MSDRPSAAETMFALAETTAKRSTCPPGVGAVLAHEDVVLAIGYNGAPRGLPHCTDAGCVVIPAVLYLETVMGEHVPRMEGREYSRHVHAELNAIIQCARDGRSTVGAELYVTRACCLDCAKAIIQAGIYMVHLYKCEPSPDQFVVIKFLRDAGVIVHWHERPER